MRSENDERSTRPTWYTVVIVLLVASIVGVALAGAYLLGRNTVTTTVVTTSTASPSTSPSKTVAGKPAAYLLEVTGANRVTIALTIGGSTTSYGNVRLPWRREVPKTDEYIGLTITADDVVTKKTLACRIDHRDGAGKMVKVAEATAEPGTYVSLGCDKV